MQLRFVHASGESYRARASRPVTDRRRFVVSAAATLLLGRGRASRAQLSGKIYRIGWLVTDPRPFPQPRLDALRELGWVEGRNLLIEPRNAASDAELPALAAELVKSKVDLIMSSGTPATRAARDATQKIPIVFTLGSDPVARGLVASLARPGANVTGFLFGLYGEKQVQVLKDALPRVVRVVVPGGNEIPSIVSAAKALAMQVLAVDLRRPEDIGPFYAQARRLRADAVLITNIAWFRAHLERLGADATANGLPSISHQRAFAEAGGLLSYGPAPNQDSPRVAAQADKIFRGANPAEIPVEQPTKFDLVINLKTAKALGLTIPQTVLLRADRIID